VARALALLFCLIAFTGCGTRSSSVSIDRKVFHKLGDSNALKGKTFAIIFLDDQQGRTLEYQTHAESMAMYLKNKGLEQETGQKPADLIVELHFEINGQEKVSSSSRAIYGTVGGTASYNTSSFGAGGTVNTYGTVTTMPRVQQVGTATSIGSYTVYARTFTLRIYAANGFKRGESVPVYEGFALSDGTSRDTPRLFPLLMSALMHDFPSKSGVMDHDLLYRLDDE
jgi:hypothetical protein